TRRIPLRPTPRAPSAGTSRSRRRERSRSSTRCATRSWPSSANAPWSGSAERSQGRIGSVKACVFALLFLAAAAARAQDVQVTASVEAETVGVNDTVLLTITVSGRDSGEATPPPRLPRFHGLQVAAGPSVSTQFQWINGRSSSSKSFTYSLIPEKEGV